MNTSPSQSVRPVGESPATPPALGAQPDKPSPIEFVAAIDRLIDGEKPSTHLWNYCVWHRKELLRSMVQYQGELMKVLAHHELRPGRVAANTEDLLRDLEACNAHARLTERLNDTEVILAATQNRVEDLLADKQALVGANEERGALLHRALAFLEEYEDREGGQSAPLRALIAHIETNVRPEAQAKQS